MNRFARASTLTVFAAAFFSAVALPVCAQSAATTVAPVETLFADASAKESAVRKALAVEAPNTTLLKAVRTVVSDYENVVRHYPASGFSDDALWHAGKLARDAFEEFREARERTSALRVFQLLASQYPTSRLARQAPEQIAWLNANPPRPSAANAPLPAPVAAAAKPVVPAKAPAAATPIAATATATAAATPAANASRLVTVKAIRRAVLADVVRIVIELDSEIAFQDERMENPSRVFLDLPSTRVVPALAERTLRFDADTDIVRQVRVGQRSNNLTRIVLETAGVSSYSIYPLYSPFRLVIDCLRTSSAVASAAPASGARPVTPPPSQPTTVLPAPRTARAPVVPALPAPPPTLLSARLVPWIAPLPSAVVVSLREATAAPPDAKPLVPLTARPSSPPAASGQPSQNLAGGLSMARQLGLGVSRIVIDPGHGGHDPGAQGPGVSEAELVLDIALRLEKLLAKLPGVEVVLTRRQNEFIPLQERTALANREGADLFLSIHANASSVPAARGIETYFLNFASNQSAAAVAARENATSEQTMGALQDVVKAIALNSKRDESRDFATFVQREMLDNLKAANKTIKDLGVKQAPFVVLIGASMPSVLAEVSFVTNPQEAKLLKGNSYRQRVAQALFEGVRAYQASLKSTPTMAQQN